MNWLVAVFSIAIYSEVHIPLMNLKNFDRTCARDGSHGLQGQCGALAEHRSESEVANSPAPKGRARK
ncbi:MAG: hypothetical protein NZ529_02465 [Cytophagaceae bacterium]|nr:hypothetical protein [Cytophagaceae bacterium]MDW8455633.1 hypothetical protein [Cytophagaceae bacterium]